MQLRCIGNQPTRQGDTGSFECLIPNQNFVEMSSYQEYLKLKARVEALQRSQSNLLGEDLGPLTTKELEQLEMFLKQIRSTNEQMLQEANRTLKRKEYHHLSILNLEETSCQNPLRLTWEAGGQSISYSRQAAQKEGFFQPLECNSTLQIGYNSVGPDQITVTTPTQNVNGFIPGWML